MHLNIGKLIRPVCRLSKLIPSSYLNVVFYSAVDLLARFSPALIVVFLSFYSTTFAGKASLLFAAVQLFASIMPLGFTNLLTRGYSKSGSYGDTLLIAAVCNTVFLSLLCCLAVRFASVVNFQYHVFSALELYSIIISALSESLYVFLYLYFTTKTLRSNLFGLASVKVFSTFSTIAVALLLGVNELAVLMLILYLPMIVFSIFILKDKLRLIRSNPSILYKILFKEFPGAFVLMLHPFILNGMVYLVRSQYEAKTSFAQLGTISILMYIVSFFGSLSGGVVSHLNSKYYRKNEDSYFYKVFSRFTVIVAPLSFVTSGLCILTFILYNYILREKEITSLLGFPNGIFLFFVFGLQIFSSVSYPLIGQNLVVSGRNKVVILTSIVSAIFAWSIYYTLLHTLAKDILPLSLLIYNALFPLSLLAFYISLTNFKLLTKQGAQA